MKKLLVTRESPCLRPLRELIERQKHRTLVLWALDCAERVLRIFEDRYPDDSRPREAVVAARAWARGEIKMPVAKRAAHATHNAATAVEGDAAACAAARAMGHVVGTVHVETHAVGVAMYRITAFVHAAGLAKADGVIARECAWFCERLKYWEEHVGEADGPWASFLLNDDAPNKERLLRLREELKRLRPKLTVKGIAKSIGACGLVCELCGDRQRGCQGCGAPGATCGGTSCSITQCCKDKGQERCFECREYPCGNFPPGEREFNNLRVLALNRVAREEGIEKLAEYLKRNYDQGIVYHRRDGLKGDYDVFADELATADFIRSGAVDRRPR